MAALQKQSIAINFAEGLDLKTDPWQIPLGKFSALTNSIFTKGGLMKKRGGFPAFTSVPAGSDCTTLTTFNGNLTAIGNNIYAYSQASDQWENRGFIKPVAQSVQSLVRSTYSQSSPDVAISPNGLALVTFLDGDGNWKYQISDYSTGQVLVSSTELPNGSAYSRAFVLGQHFVITFLITITATVHLQYITIPITSINSPSGQVNVSSQVSSINAGYDGYVENSFLYLAWDGSDIGGAIRATHINSFLTQFATIVIAGHSASLMSVTADNTQTTPVIWLSYYKSNNAYTSAYSPSLVQILAPTQIITSTTINELTSAASDMSLTAFYQVPNTYPSSVRSDYISSVTCSQAGSVGNPIVVERSVGLASKAFFIGDTAYMLAIYGNPGVEYQPTYFLIDENGNVISKVAYSNAGGYAPNQILPSANVAGNMVQIGYLFADLIAAVNKSMNAPSVAGIYSQTGVNLLSVNLSSTNLSTVEISNNLVIAGGITWGYDGVKPTELGFSLWPEDITLASDMSGGSMTPQEYFYQVTYEWTDGQGNINRSAPSIPQSITLTSDTEVVLTIPTLRLTYKTAPNAARIVIYRWSQGQQTFYQITSITSPLINDPTVDTVTYTDTQADSAIIGNNILYTTGGVVENIAPPGTSILFLFSNRVFLVDSENPNNLWYSKTVIPATPVEMSDLFTIFIAPTSGAQGSTGILTAGSPMDDKAILFKKDAAYYITGKGPDNTGSNNDFSEPIFITSTVGTSNQQSIGFIPQGLTFQSDKGIWLLGRDLSTSYIGSPVEDFNGQLVSASAVIPTTNQVRYSIEPGISNTIYKGLHTILNSLGQVCQENDSIYQDGDLGDMLMYDYFYGQWGTFNMDSGPTLLSFATSWLNLASLQGFERSYFFYILGQWLSPHKLNIDVAYDYNESPTQSTLIQPNNYSLNYGVDPLYGDGSPYGGPGNVEQWRIFFKTQKCQSFKLTISEIYDDSQGVMPGPGLTFSGLDVVVGLKSSYPRIPTAQQAG